MDTNLVFTASITLVPFTLRMLYDLPQHSSWVSADGLSGIRVQERNEEERHVILPRDTAERREIDFR